MSENNSVIRQLAELCETIGLESQHPLRKLVDTLAINQDEEHEGWKHDLALYVVDELMGLDVGKRYPELHHHLQQCPQCAELHTSLLEDFTENPVPVESPSPDLSFLPQLAPTQTSLLQDLPAATKAAIEFLVSIEWPELKTEIAIAARIFFRQLENFDGEFRLQPGMAHAMGFGGGEVSVSQRLVVASYRANQILQSTVLDNQSLGPAQIRTAARSAALQASQELKLSGGERERFVKAYQNWATDRLTS